MGKIKIWGEIMSIQERILYHQIHPVKLATDIVSAILALYFFWRHNFIAGIVVGFIPPIIASTVIMQSVDLEPYRRSALGQYIARYMTRTMEFVRFTGFVVAALGAWYHSVVILGGIKATAA